MRRRTVRLSHIKRAHHRASGRIRHGRADGDDPSRRDGRVSEARVAGTCRQRAGSCGNFASVPERLRKDDGGHPARENRLPRATRPINTGDTTGWVVTYDFDDITSVQLDLLPQMPGLHGFYRVAAKEAGASTALRATLEPVSDAEERLTFHFPRFAMDQSGEPPGAWASGSSQEMDAFRTLLKGSRVTMTVDSAAPIVRTNSPFRQQNRVTLLDVDVEQALFSKQIAMLASTPSTFEDLLSAFADLPGVTLAHDLDITIDLENPSAQVSAPPPQALAQSPPDTEIYLATLISTDGKLAVGPPINISRSPGYDNQPSFTPDGNQILFASVRGAVNAARDAGSGSPAPPATDIYRYDVASRGISRVTSTPEGEFSPAVMPDGADISVVRVEADGTQRLWRIANVDNVKGASSVILPDIKPVGYYAWIDNRTVALYVLGERGQAATLQVADIRTGKPEVIASDIGRSIQRMPSGAVSYVRRQRDPVEGSPRGWEIYQLLRSPEGSLQNQVLLSPPPGASADPYIAWMPDGSALSAVNSVLYRWRRGVAGWTRVANLGAFGLRDVTRLAISPKGDRIAIVASPK